jgi:tRNA(Ile)-lysidine synthase
LSEPLANRLLFHLRHSGLLRPGDRVAVAVSGGADSVALVGLLAELHGELGIILSVAHFNHKIRGGASDEDEQFVRELAGRLDLEFHGAKGDVPAHAANARLSLETAARELRYRFFEQMLESGRATRIATAHTLDDQAETVLLKFLRGAWTQGLAGIYPRLALGEGAIVRPLLPFRRSELREYLGAIGQTWHEDASNLDLHHARNRVRHVLLPVIEREFNPAIAEMLAGVSEIARGEQDFWNLMLEKRTSEISSEMLQHMPLAMQRRAVRAAAEDLGFTLDFRQVEQVLTLASPDGPARFELPDGWFAEKVFQEVDPGAGKFLSSLTGERASGIKRRLIRFRRLVPGADYEYRLAVPGEVAVPELGAVVRACLVEVGGVEQEDVLDRRAVGAEVTIRNWRAGDRFWPAHTSGPKKIKELLQHKHIGGSDRAAWPVAVVEGEIVWVKGFAVPKRLRAQGSGVRIEVVGKGCL